MKFGKKIQAVSGASLKLCEPSEWLNYKQLKKQLHALDVRNTQQIGKKRNLQDVEGEKIFFKSLLSELKKVDRTFLRLEKNIIEQFLKFVHKFRPILKEVSRDSNLEIVSTVMKHCAAIHLQFVLLENYAVMNYCGFTKILKKHDKVTGFLTREKYMLKMVNECEFSKHSRVDDALKVVGKEFENLKKMVVEIEKVRKINDEEEETKDEDLAQGVAIERVIRDHKTVSEATSEELSKENHDNSSIGDRTEDNTMLPMYKNHQDRLDSLVHLLETHVRKGHENGKMHIHPSNLDHVQKNQRKKTNPAVDTATTAQS
mmetsp:Transcript_19250/g.24486  ORF Transcript_19250/g.24486 Transcript_19250/m.24486 type:complete len:315 (-) Transcript_19250:1638-2582(-)|eukprot:CAMPEP_0204862490 /NCGR_PEP_ID=MMETSP1348-20121228/2562_1 /ASSEMBLY_ACC=CAM_ASM_000700 /TAXON_ID=215587 /ORGANISM="Aplanochytrium stocchinoi, Strain GSBS06" /LENGTH=314 /DNA_ID=CAMNT_0052012457 /DNA_START=497 /DNA_END=1441 /DNA_ORIENTATION=-